MYYIVARSDLFRSEVLGILEDREEAERRAGKAASDFPEKYREVLVFDSEDATYSYSSRDRRQ